MKVVIDTNALVAARFSPSGAAARVLELCIRGELQALFTDGIERENRAILSRVKPSPEFRERLEAFYSSASRVHTTLSLDVVEDPQDNKYLECALAGRADYVISSDRHLLEFDGVEGIRICKAGQFLDEVGSRSES